MCVFVLMLKYCMSSRSDSQRQKKQMHHDLIIHRKETYVQGEHSVDVQFPKMLCSQHISVLFLYFCIFLLQYKLQTYIYVLTYILTCVYACVSV